MAVAGLMALSSFGMAQSRARAQVVSAACNVEGAIDAFKRYLGPTRYSGATDWSNYKNAGWTPPKGYRQITWDGVAKNFVDYDYIPYDYFNNASKQGLLYYTGGRGFRVSSDAYSYLNPSYAKTFKYYSPNYLFSPIYSNVLDVLFEVPGYRGDRGWLHGFGAVFSDVDKANVTRMEFFDERGYSLGTWYAQPCDYGSSFLGVYFYDAWVSKVRIWLGDKPLDSYVTEDPYTDLVVLDDFIYDEPWKYGWTGQAGNNDYAPPPPPTY